MAPSAKRAALIGFDCLIPKRLQRLLKEGGLDNFRRFIKEGSYMTEGFNLPTVTPPSWATICTGAFPRTHGVEDYTKASLSITSTPPRPSAPTSSQPRPSGTPGTRPARRASW